ncbi:MAG: XRE family transcriptional regulator [Oscillospiraceae bacterium]|nr:XRE family transcriptional regulator [Oscillospiraceae bacterium]
MDISIGSTLIYLRKSHKLMQKDVAAALSDYGFKVNSKTIYNWEKEISQPSIPLFLALCDLLDVDDVLWRFAGMQKGPYAGLNQDGRKKARDFIELLHQIDAFRDDNADVDVYDESTDAHDGSSGIYADDGNDGTASGGDDSDMQNVPPRILRLYDIPVSAGGGNFLGDGGFTEIEVPSYVPIAVDFALRLSGDSMEPLLTDGQVIWVKEQDVLDSGDIGIFAYSDNVYCKKLIAEGKRAFLRSLNPLYSDIEIKEDFGFRAIGKVVS